MAREALLLITLCALGGTSYWLSRLRPEKPVQTSPAAVVVPEQEAAVPAQATVDRAAQPPAPAADHTRELALPDGTFVPTLNDSIDAPPLAEYWGTWPWSPIVGVQRSEAGIDWYQHADGSCSTTQMVWRSDYNRYMAMTRVGHPSTTTAPTAPKANR
jgi:hypothetical protein